MEFGTLGLSMLWGQGDRDRGQREGNKRQGHGDVSVEVAGVTCTSSGKDPHPAPGPAVPVVPPPASPVPSPFQPRPSASRVSARPAVPSPVLALAGWCPLSPPGAQSPQLLVETPWTLAVLWDRVTLSCQGSGTAGATTW